MASKLQRSYDDITAWNLRKINTNVWRFAQSLTEISVMARTKQLDVQAAGPILNNMLMSVDLLQRDANTLLQPCKTNIDATGCQTEPKTSSENTLDTELCGQSASLPFFPDSYPMTKGNELQSSPNQTGQAQARISYNDLAKRLNQIEQIVVGQNLLKRLNKIEQNQNSDKSISKRLELIETLKLPAELPNRINALESEFCPAISGRIDKLENYMTEVIQCVFGQSTDVKQVVPCIVAQLSDFRGALDEGTSRLQAIEDSFRKSGPRDVSTPEESQSITKKTKEETSSGNDKTKSAGMPTQVQPSDDKSIAFQVRLDREGVWSDGAIMNKATVRYNQGNAFCQKGARFTAPVDGRYCFGVWVERDTAGEETKLEVWRCRGQTYIRRLFYVLLSSTQMQKGHTVVQKLLAGDSLVARVFGAKNIDMCMFQGFLFDDDTREHEKVEQNLNEIFKHLFQ